MNKDCGNHGDGDRHKLYRQLFSFLLALIVLVLFVIFIVWLVLRPTKPKFLLQDLSVQQLNLNGPDFLSTTMQATVSSRNPNDRIGIYYDRLDIFVQYKGQQITGATRLPAGYQGHNDVTVWSPFLFGTAVPVSPYLGVAVSQDEAAGFVLVYVKVVGKLRWKVGTWISGHYHIQASCPAFLTVQNDGGGVSMFQFQRMAECSVDV